MEWGSEHRTLEIIPGQLNRKYGKPVSFKIFAKNAPVLFSHTLNNKSCENQTKGISHLKIVS